MNRPEPRTRIQRLERLVALRDGVNREIAGIEAEVAAEIVAMRRAKEASARQQARFRNRRIAVCGTDSGYYKHLRSEGLPACDACRLAHRVAERDRLARRRETSA